MNLVFTKAQIKDLDVLEALEKTCFPPFQQNNRRSIRTSITSVFQDIFIIEMVQGKQKKPVGSVTLYYYPKTLRFFSLAVFPEFQGKGIGKKAFQFVYDLARQKGYRRISLEVRQKNMHLVKMYEKLGYKITETLPDYYAPGETGLRMVAPVTENLEKQNISNIIIVRNPKKWELNIEGVKVVSAREYITDEKYRDLKNVRIFNLSNSYRYQKMGYYVSLLASARDHRVIPNVTTLRDFSSLALIRSLSDYIDEEIQKTLAKITDSKLSMYIYFGKSVNPKFTQLAYKLYQLFEAPLLQIVFSKNGKWIVQKVTPLSFKKVLPEHMDKVKEFASDYFSKKRFKKPRFKNYKYDLAILVNPDEKNPPSCPVALENFKKAGEKLGFYVDFITKNDFDQIPEYDALFIRETTSVHNHTYQFSRKAYAEGLVVIDDPWSILRCSNKIYQNERLKQNKIKTPETIILAKSTFRKGKELPIGFPMVLKQPDSAFSMGVVKVTNHEELESALKKLFNISDLIVAQEFLFSEYDWRIGILDQTPLYACRYYMAKNHWQIYKWDNETRQEGDSDTLPLDEVPEIVLNTAVKAASLIGDGLYGVDLKYINGEVYIIETNDNPNIDSGIEDLVLKEEVYLKIMKSIFNRIEVNRNIAQFISE
jgi:glutathione synthase/RimK-type ligase-like ATP-grasp enzyme/ribosomal protein S18 acetylase RimI-like enzyme